MHLLFWECATPLRSARWLGWALHTGTARLDRLANGHAESSETALWAFAALLELTAYSAIAVALGPALAHAANQDFPAALGLAWEDLLGADPVGARARLAIVVLFAGLCVQLVCLAINVCVCAVELCRACSRIASKRKNKSD